HHTFSLPVENGDHGVHSESHHQHSGRSPSAHNDGSRPDCCTCLGSCSIPGGIAVLAADSAAATIVAGSADSGNHLAPQQPDPRRISFLIPFSTAPPPVAL